MNLFQLMTLIQTIRCTDCMGWIAQRRVIPSSNLRNFMYTQQLKSTIPSNKSYYKDVIDSTQYPASLINSGLNAGPSYFDLYADIFEDLTGTWSGSTVWSPWDFLIKKHYWIMTHRRLKNLWKTEYKDGNYLVQLPCHKDKLARVNSNHRAALNVLGHVVTDLEKKGLYKQYKMFKRQSDRKNHRTLPPNPYRNCVWLPHWLIFKNETASTMKVHPVFNCSLKVGGRVSLH